MPALLAAPRRPRAHAAALLDLSTYEELGLWQALTATMLDWEDGDHPLLGGHSIETLANELRERPASVMRLLKLALDALHVPAAPPLLVLDRFEALLRTATDAQVDRFVAALDTMVRSRALTVLVVCRNDFYAEVARRPALMEGKAHGAHIDLVPPDAQALAQMVRLLAEAAGLLYGKDPSGLRRLDDILCADAAPACDALPLLQY